MDTAIFSFNNCQRWDYNTKLVTMHTPGTQKLNYHPEYYRAITAQAEVFREEEIEQTAKENLKAIGDMYHYE